MPQNLTFRNRVKEFRYVRAGDLIPNKANWRQHPKPQVDALKGVLSEIGFAGAVLAYEDNGQLVLIDGHPRASLAPTRLIHA